MAHIIEISNLQQLGVAIRQARQELGLTQEKLADAAGLARETVSLLENGLVPELGFGKVCALLRAVGLNLLVAQQTGQVEADVVALAATAASVSFKESLTKEELIHAILTGSVSAGRRPHIRALLEEADEALLTGLFAQLRRQTTPGRLENGVEKLANSIGIKRNLTRWLKSD
jgi:transcriptional regulator with XRE-family HTH domain